MAELSETIQLDKTGVETIIHRVVDETDRLRMPEIYKAGIYRGLAMALRSVRQDLGLALGEALPVVFREVMHLREVAADELGAQIPEDDEVLP